MPKSLPGFTRKYSTTKEVYNTKVKLVYYSDIVKILSKENKIAIKKNKKIAINFLNFHLPLIEKCEKIEINENDELVIIFQLNNKNFGTALINTYAYANLINSLENELKRYFRLRKKDFLTFFNEHLKICKDNMNRTATFLDVIILTREEGLKNHPYRDTSYSSFKLIELNYSGDLSLSDVDLSVNQQLTPITHTVMENFENVLKTWKKK